MVARGVLARGSSRLGVLLPAALFGLAPLSLTGVNLLTPLLAGTLAYQAAEVARLSRDWPLGQAVAIRLRGAAPATARLSAWRRPRPLAVDRRAAPP